MSTVAQRSIQRYSSWNQNQITAEDDASAINMQQGNGLLARYSLPPTDTAIEPLLLQEAMVTAPTSPPRRRAAKITQGAIYGQLLDHAQNATVQVATKSDLKTSDIIRLSSEKRAEYFSQRANVGVAGFFSGFLKTVAGFVGLAALTTMTGSALVPLIGVPLLCDWLTDKGGDELGKWANEAQLWNRNAYAGLEQTALVARLARQLQEAQRHNTALVSDMGRFLHETNALQSYVAATEQEKHLQGALFKRLRVEVDRQQDILGHLLSSDLTAARTTIINTGGGAYIGGNLKVRGNFTGRDDITQFISPELMNVYAGRDTSQARHTSYEKDQAATVDTEGGAYVNGNAEVGGDFVGRDRMKWHVNE